MKKTAMLFPQENKAADPTFFLYADNRAASLY
jgi:hypothetical protein